MPFNGSGTYSPPGADFPAVTGTVISSTKYNNVVNDIATALSNAVTRDGQSAFLANIPAGSFKITGLGAATTAGDALSFGAAATITNLTLSGTGRKISADMDNATLNNRLAFQGSTVNGSTSVEAIPNGTSQAAQYAVWNNSDRTNAGVGILGINASQVALTSTKTGSGTALPFVISCGVNWTWAINGGLSNSAPAGGVIPLTLTAPAAGIALRATDGTISADLANFLSSTLFFGTTTNHPVVFFANNRAACITIATTGAVTVSAPASGVGLTVAGGGAAFTGNVSVAGGTFTTRGFVDNATAAAWNIDASGRLLNNGDTQPTVQAHTSAVRTTNGAFASYSEVHDLGGNFNPTTGVFTAPVAGTYLFLATSRGIVTSGTGFIDLNFAKNGSVATTTVIDTEVPLPSTTVQGSGTVHAIFDLAASDTVDFRLTGIGGTGASAIATSFTAVLLG